MSKIKSFFKAFTHPVILHLIFWSWNLLFLILLGFLEVEVGFLLNIIKDAFVGKTPLDLAIFSIIGFTVPIFTLIVAFTKFLHQPRKLIQLFYGVEVPILIICYCRVWLFRELNPATTHTLFLVLAGMIAFTVYLFKGNLNKSRFIASVQLTAHTIMLLIGTIFSIFATFYIIPGLGAFFKSIPHWDLSFLAHIGFWIFLALLLYILTATLLIGLPIAFLTIYYRSFKKRFKSYSEQFSKRRALAIVIGFLVVNTAVYISLNSDQPQLYAFEKLDKEDKTIEDKKEILKNQKEIKSGLVNAYLSKHRYISAYKDNNHIDEMYHEVFGIENTEWLTNIYNFFIMPFLYEGDMRKDRKKAEKQYEAYFDQTIQRGETDAIKSAIKATWERDGIEASLININEEKVLITDQEINVTENNDVAEIEIHERYLNKTFSQQEILYYFSLPENAVVTGLWLSDNDSISKQYKYRVSARGAAQQVYKNEVRRRVDPSLLEKVGPNQYRLRAFPIERRRREWSKKRRNREYIDGNAFHLWLSYKTFADKNQAWELPKLNEKRNVYWDASTNLKINGIDVDKDDTWMPNAIAVKQNSSPQQHVLNLDSLSIIATKITESPNLSTEKLKVAVIIDQTFSMNEQKEKVESEIASLKECEWIDQSSFVYINQSEKRPLKDFEGLEDYLMFGRKSQLKTISELQYNIDHNRFDAALYLTDEGSYEAAEDSAEFIKTSTPIFLIHLNGHFPGAYPDPLIETIKRSGGKSCLSTTKAIDFIRTEKWIKSQAKSTNPPIALDNGYLFTIGDSAQKTTGDNQILASKFIDYLDKKHQSNELEILDRTNVLAKQFGIVTDYSSMIVLVNQRQHDALDAAEKKDDRFDREIEDGTENVTQPGNFMEVNGTPEPEEWLLIILGGSALIMLYRKKVLGMMRIG